MAEGEGHYAFAEEELLQEPCHAAAVEFEHAATNAGAGQPVQTPIMPRPKPRSEYGEAQSMARSRRGTLTRPRFDMT